MPTKDFLDKPKVWGRSDTFSGKPKAVRGYSTTYTEIDPRSIPGGEMISHTRRGNGKGASSNHSWGEKGIEKTRG